MQDQQQSPPPYHPDMAALFEWRKRRKRGSNDLPDQVVETETESTTSDLLMRQSFESSNWTLPEVSSTGWDIDPTLLSYFGKEEAPATARMDVKPTPSDPREDLRLRANLFPIPGEYGVSLPQVVDSPDSTITAVTTKIPNNKAPTTDTLDAKVTARGNSPTGEEKIPVPIFEPYTSKTYTGTSRPAVPVYRSRKQSWLDYHAMNHDWKEEDKVYHRSTSTRTSKDTRPP